MPTINVRSYYSDFKEWIFGWWWKSGGEIVFILVFTGINFILKQIGDGYGLFVMDWQIQFWVYLFMISFAVYINFGVTKWIIKKLNPFNMTHLMDLNPSKNADIDHLIGGEDLMKSMPVVGSDGLGERSAGEDGQSEVYISRKVTKITENNISEFEDEYDVEVGDLLPVSTWRGIKSPDEIERYEEYIQANTFILEHKMEEYQRLNNSLLTYKRMVKSEIWNAVQDEWDQINSMEETPSFEQFKQSAMAGVDIDQENVGIPSENLTEEEQKRIDEAIDDAIESKNLNNNSDNNNNNE